MSASVSRVNGFYMAAEEAEFAGQFSSITREVAGAAEQSSSLRRMAEEAGKQHTSIERMADNAAAESWSIRRMSEEFARHYEPTTRQLRDAELAFNRADMPHMQQVRAITAHMEPLVTSVRLNLLSSVKLDLGLANIRPILDDLAKSRVDWAALSEAMSRAAALPGLAPAGTGVMPKMAVSGAGQVVLPGDTNAWPAIAEQLQRIGALPCGQVYAIVFFLVLIVLLPKVAEGIGDAALFVGVTNAIIRNGRRRGYGFAAGCPVSSPSTVCQAVHRTSGIRFCPA